MMALTLTLLLSLAVTVCAAAGPQSCVGRCGELFTRGRPCACDSGCLRYNECCPDFQAACVAAPSCRGRCGEAFSRGQPCQCDPQCLHYNTCCHDYQLHCDAGVSVSHSRGFHPLKASSPGKRKRQKSRKDSNSESEEWYTGGAPCPRCQGPLGRLNPLTDRSSGPASPALPTNPLQHAASHTFAAHLPAFSHFSGAPDNVAPGSSLPSNSAPSLGNGAPVSPSGPGDAGVNVHLVLSHGGAAPSGGTGQGLGGSLGSRPSTLRDVVQALGLPSVDGGPEGAQEGVDLCSDAPISGLTALSNGTILIFKDEHFWSVDPLSHSVGPPQSIMDTLGVPSPIDTVFTRCNCHGTTYIIKGDQYWRLDGNMVMEPGFPKPLTSEFPDLTGSVTAALVVPASRTRPETVYFFKNGDILQGFTFPSGSTPSCSKKPRSSANRRPPRQAGVLSGVINLQVKGLPTPVTSALSMPPPQRSGTYEHYVFSGPLFFKVQILGDLPVLVTADAPAAPAPLAILSPSDVAPQQTNPAPANSIRVWLQCLP